MTKEVLMSSAAIKKQKAPERDQLVELHSESQFLTGGKSQVYLYSLVMNH